MDAYNISIIKHLSVKVNNRARRRQEDANKTIKWTVFPPLFFNISKLFIRRRSVWKPLLCCITSRKKNLMLSLCEPNDGYAPRGEDVEVHPAQQDSFGYSNISETFEILGNHWLHTSFLWRHPLQSWSVYLASLGISFTLSKKVNREGFGG